MAESEVAAGVKHQFAGPNGGEFNGHALNLGAADAAFVDYKASPSEDDWFDAFDPSTWEHPFQPTPPPPAYRRPQVATALIASAVALAAIVVSAVLLVFRVGDPPEAPTRPHSDSSTEPQTTTPTPMPTPIATTTPPEAPPPAPAEPPPAQAPVINEPRVRTSETPRIRESGPPTPITRMPISVSPAPWGQQPNQRSDSSKNRRDRGLF
jgi:hypothetical protein